MVDLDNQNREFWDELCGTYLAKTIGINDHSLISLRQFDRTYFEIYPYLLRYVKTDKLKGKKILEVGLGYGSLGQKIAEAGADYVGLDVAAGPAKMVNYRLKMNSLPGISVQGSMLECPFESESFDYVVSIGCFHHTGNVQRCIDETYRVLKSDGTSLIMIYNKFSYRQWLLHPIQALVQSFHEKRGNHSLKGQGMIYDCDSSGSPAPETVCLSVRQLRMMFNKFSGIQFHKENFHQFFLKNKFFPSKKNFIMDTLIAKPLGLDIYVLAKK